MSKAHLLTARLRTLEALAPMMAEAKRDGLLIYNKWQNRYFTPIELMEELKVGRYVWGPKCWQLRRPLEN